MDDNATPALATIRANEETVGNYMRTVCDPYIRLSADLLDFTAAFVGGLDEGEPSAQHAVALILARVATETRAATHLVTLGYPVQAYTLVGTLLELVHTAAYVGGDDSRARAYFEHADRSRAYPGSVKSTIKAVGEEIGVPRELIEREYDTFYNQMCLVKHGNPMAMSLGAVVDDSTIWISIGPVLTAPSVRLALATMQQATRYLLLGLAVYLRHHVEGARRVEQRAELERLSERWGELNGKAAGLVKQLERIEDP